MMKTGTNERRPAIWPWLVMPLVTLALFCALFRLRQNQDTPYGGVSHTAASAPADSYTP
jgi:hypothetical protein